MRTGDKCLHCKRKVSISNLKNLQCKKCCKFCHPKCAKSLPQIRLKKCKQNSYKIIRSQNWECEACILAELPFFDISNSQIIKLKSSNDVPKIPSAVELNNLFVNQTDEEENENLEFSYHLNKTRYMLTHEIENLNFENESQTYESFPIISVNIRSIVNSKNFRKFESLLESLPIKPMVIAINESWATKSSQGAFKKIPGYHEFVQNSRSNTVGGGVGFYISDHLHFSVIDSLSIMEDKSFESLFLNVHVGPKKIICGTLYRSPSNNHDFFSETLKAVLKKVDKLHDSTIIMGDFNYNLLSIQNKHVSASVDTFFEYGFYPLINIPTRITETTGSVLDHFWTNIVEQPIKSAVLVKPISDHLPIYMNIGMTTPTEKIVIEKRCFSQKAIAKFNRNLRKMDIFDILGKSSTNAAYNLFIKKYMKIFENSFPIKKKKVNPKKKHNRPWYTEELKRLDYIKQQDYLNHIRNKNSLFLKSTYNKSRNVYFRKVKELKRNYFQNFLNDVKHCIKGTWKVINSVLGRETNKDLFKISINGKEVENKTSIATEFNSYFSNVAKNLVKEIPSCKWRKRFDQYLGRKNPKSLVFKRTCPKEISKILKCLAEKTSSGWDTIPQKVIKSNPYNILMALSHIFNLSIKEGIFPQKMKLAKVIPIFKKGSKLCVENYRPISLLPVFSKILERLICNRLVSFLNECNILYDKQFGFRMNHSTSHATSYLSSKLYNALDESEKAVSVFMDLSKAFDTLDLKILLQKLSHYGIRGLENKWFASYLTDRQQFVEINSHRSTNVCDIEHGVPQGSILGPILFNLYINDFYNCLTFGEAIMFADDTTLVFKCKDKTYLEAMVNEDLQSASEWLAENKLSLNIKKTNFMSFDLSRSKSVLPTISIGKEFVKAVKTHKFLGVIFDDKLSWKEHILSVISKLNSCLGATRRARTYLNKSALFTIYYSLMQSHTQYCCETWAAWEPRGNQIILQRLQAVCNKFFRLIFNLDRQDSVRGLLKSNNILNMRQMYNYTVGKTMHRARHGTLPAPLLSVFERNLENDLFMHHSSRIKQTEKSISQAGPKIWDDIPYTVARQSDYKKFQFELKRAVINEVN